MTVAITAFAVPVEADERFVAGWTGSAGARLHRALRSDVDFRFVAVGHLEPAGGEFAAHSALYDVVHEAGAPEGHGGVVLIDPFEVADGADAEFLAAWEAARLQLAGRPGHLGTRLHRSAGPADLRFVSLARWSSPLMLARAAGVEVPFASHPALYTIVRE